MAFNYGGLVEKSIVAEGVEGKVVVVYGGNNLGKSSQLAKANGVVFLPFESNALNAVGGTSKLPVSDYATFKDFVESMKSDKIKLEQLRSSLDRKTLRFEKAKEDKDTSKDDIKDMEDGLVKIQNKIQDNSFLKFQNEHPIICIDSITALDKSAEKFITDAYDVVELGDVAHGKLYKRFENEFYHCINDFLNLGFTYFFTAHAILGDGDTVILDDEGEKVQKLYPKGTWKRVVKPIIDRSDIIVYLKSNGVDENGDVIPSSGYLRETKEYFARSKWDNMANFIEVFTYDNLVKVIDEAIAEQKKNGVNVGSFKQQQKNISDRQGEDHKVLIDEIGNLVKKVIYKHDKDIDGVNMLRYQQVVYEILGDEKTVSDCTAKQIDHLKNILSQTKDIVDTLEDIDNKKETE